MRAFEKKKNDFYSRNKKDHESDHGEQVLFRVVVNNYRQEKEEKLKGHVDDDIAGELTEEIGLPPQPTSYIKYPTYDWF